MRLLNARRAEALARVARSTGGYPRAARQSSSLLPTCLSSRGSRRSSRRPWSGPGCRRIRACPSSCRRCSRGPHRSARPRGGSAAHGRDDRRRSPGSRSSRRGRACRSGCGLTSGERAAPDRAARAVIAGNDMGSFVRPGRELYPHQWNWDSAFVALGLAHVDPDRGQGRGAIAARGPVGRRDGSAHRLPCPRAGLLARTGAVGLRLLRGGAPEVADERITQPPVLATAVRVLHEADAGSRSSSRRSSPRSSGGTRGSTDERGTADGLVAILHPWEGADNSPRFDAHWHGSRWTRGSPSSARDRARGRRRRSGRPTATTCATCISSGNSKRRGTGPSLARRAVRLRRSHLQLRSSPRPRPTSRCSGAELGERRRPRAGRRGARARGAGRALGRRAGRLRRGRRRRPDGDETDRWRCSRSTRGCPSPEQARRLFDEALWSPARFGPSPEAPWAVTTASKSSPAFDPRRYWRGPVWVNINWFLMRGLERAGLAAEAEELRRLTLELVGRLRVRRVLRPDEAASRSAAATSPGARR